MSNLDEKVNDLIADIKRQSENENKAITREMADYREASLKEAEQAIAFAAKKHIKRSVESGASEIASELASKHLNARNELVSMRSKMTDEIIQRAAGKLMEFTKTDKYPAALCKSAKEIAEVLKSNRIVLYVRPEDIVYSDLIKEAFGKYCTVAIDRDIKIGGIKGYDKILFKVADETLDGKLAVQREYFVNNSGLTISVR